jgi:BlaI family transcriptional regulator, penicillinase repressor
VDEIVLGDRELDVMAVLWQAGSGTVTEVREVLPADLAYTTVLTILRNLEAKGFVRHEVRGKAHRYFPVVARQQARKSALTRVIDGLFHSSPEEVVTHLVEERELSAADLRRISNHLSSVTRRRKGGNKK